MLNVIFTPQEIKVIPGHRAWREGKDGHQYLFRFENDFGASVIDYGYGSEKGLYELAVINFVDDHEWHLTYKTPVTDDVMGFLTEEEVENTLKKIAKLRRVTLLERIRRWFRGN